MVKSHYRSGHQGAVTPRFVRRTSPAPMTHSGQLLQIKGVRGASASPPIAPALGMNILGEPVGRQFTTESAFPGLAVHHRASGCELITQPQIVDETGDLLVRATAIGFAGDHVREGWGASEVDPFA